MEDGLDITDLELDELNKKKKFGISDFAKGLSKKEVSNQLSSTLSEASGMEIKPKDVSPKVLEKVQQEAQVKPLEQKQAEVADKKSPSSQDKIFLALAAALPTIIGAAVGGAEGGAAGGQIGAKLATDIGAGWAADEKDKQDQLAKSEELKAKALEKQSDRDFQKELKGMETGAKAKEQEFSNVQNLRKEYEGNAVTKATREVSSAYKKVMGAVEDPSPAGDLALVYGFNKMLDPGSAVKEGEFANAENAKGVPEQYRSMYNKILSGERLTPAQRQDFLNQAGNLFRAQSQQQSALDQGFAAQASKFGLDPKDILFGGIEAPVKQEKFNAEDMAALEWANKNPKDPRAALILQKLQPRSIAR